MTTRVGKRRRRVAEAEAALVTHRQALRVQWHSLAADARTAATPGRIVVGGLAIGALTGLLTGRRARARQADAASAPTPGLVQSLTGMFRLASLVMPLLGPLLAMVQGSATGPEAPAPAADAPAATDGDPLP